MMAKNHGHTTKEADMVGNQSLDFRVGGDNQGVAIANNWRNVNVHILRGENSNQSINHGPQVNFHNCEM